MGYMHIENLYKYPYIFNFPRVYALEKIHGTSAHIRYHGGSLNLFSGGVKHEAFAKLFDATMLEATMQEMCEFNDWTGFTVYGEAYGGSCQGMSDTYGKELRFVAFDVCVERLRGQEWLRVPEAFVWVKKLGLDFVAWQEADCKLDTLNALRDLPSKQAERNGCGNDKPAEGIVIRPLEETVDGRGNRVICKHKRDDFRETRTPREVDPEKLKVLEQADAIANEWVTPMRLTHVLDKMPGIAASVEATGAVIKAMIEDVKREAEGEVVWSKDVERKIGTATAVMFKRRLQERIRERDERQGLGDSAVPALGS